MKYPYDIVSIVRQKTLSIEAHFTQGKEESPMKVFDSTFSRFSATIIADSQTAYFNIPIEALPGVRVRTDIAANEQFRPKAIVPKNTSSTDIDTNSIAFTKKFVTGTLKGKSPAEVLMEDPVNGSKTLNGQYKWLKDHLQQYPKNQDLMDAIMTASKLDLSKLSDADTGNMTSSSIVLLDIGCRPLIRKEREDGKCFVYEGKVVWDTSRNYPVTVTIKNYYANVKKNENGTLNVNLSSKDKDTAIEKEFNMTADEWLSTIHEMESARDCFKLCHFNEGWKLAESAAAEARKAARKVS